MKLITIGNSSVGKTALIMRYFDGVFSHSAIPTMSVVTKYHTLNILDKNVRLQVYDTAGQEKFKVLTANYYREAAGVLIVYDCTDIESFQGI